MDTGHGGVRTSVERALRGLLWDKVPRNHRQDPRPFLVRRVVTGVFVVIGAVVLGWGSLQIEEVDGATSLRPLSTFEIVDNDTPDLLGDGGEGDPIFDRLRLHVASIAAKLSVASGRPSGIGCSRQHTPFQQEPTWPDSPATTGSRCGS